MTALLALDGVHVRLGGSHVLQGLSFDVPEGGVTALLGRNGVGKTTTLKAVLGLVARTGSIRLAGSDISSLRTHQVVRRGIAYVPEDREVFGSLTVAENLRLAERAADPRYDIVHGLFPELADRARQLAGTLSGGQQQMLAIGRALLNNDRLLLVDEPTKGLSPRYVAEAALALARAAEIATVVLVEQDLAVVRRLAHHAVVLDHGEVQYAGPADRLLADTALVHRLLGVGSRSSAPSEVTT